MTVGGALETPLPTGNASEEGFIPERLDRLGTAMQKYVDEGRLPNVVTLVARHGRIVHRAAHGKLAVDQQAPVSSDSIFRLYSNSKPICGVATMILFEEGKLSPDDPVSKYIPAFRNPRVRRATIGSPPEPARREITVRDCLRHTSGIATTNAIPLILRSTYREEFAKLGWDRDDASPAQSVSDIGAKTAREYAEALARLPLSFHPGSSFEYHAGYVVSGAIIEEVAGQSLDDFYRKRIFEPLGMVDSGFTLDQSKLDRFTSNHLVAGKNGDGWRLSIIDRAATSDKLNQAETFFEAGGGVGAGVVSTAGDYARFGQMLLNGGELDGVRILSRKTVEYMTSDHSEGLPATLPGPGYGWGLGVAVRHGRDALPAFHSNGSFTWLGYAGTNWLADPVEDLQVICFTQVVPTMLDRPYWRDCERIVYQALA